MIVGEAEKRTTGDLLRRKEREDRGTGPPNTPLAFQEIPVFLINEF
jgi:hypothetical protein